MEAIVLSTVKLPSKAILMIGARTLSFETAEIKILGPPEVNVNGLMRSPELPMFYSLVVNNETVLTARRFNLESDANDTYIFDLEDCVFVSDSIMAV